MIPVAPTWCNDYFQAFTCHMQKMSLLPVLCQGLKKSSVWKFCCITHWIITKLLKCRIEIVVQHEIKHLIGTWQTYSTHFTASFKVTNCFKVRFQLCSSRGWRMCSLSVGCLLYNWKWLCTSSVGMELKLCELSWNFDLVGFGKYSCPQLEMTIADPKP